MKGLAAERLAITLSWAGRIGRRTTTVTSDLPGRRLSGAVSVSYIFRGHPMSDSGGGMKQESDLKWSGTLHTTAAHQALHMKAFFTPYSNSLHVINCSACH